MSPEPDPENFRARFLVYLHLRRRTASACSTTTKLALLGDKCGPAIDFLYAEAQALNA